jgi:tetratricopeptide (TPR) repeat protein
MKDFGAGKEYETREAARILDLPEEQIRSCVRAGFLKPSAPGRKYRFSFQDLLILKTTKALLDSGIPARRVARLMDSLRRELPEGAPLSGFTIEADGRRLVVSDGSARWEPDSGQFLIDFETGDAKRIEAPVAGRVLTLHVPATEEADDAEAAGHEAGLNAEQWYDLACELEGESRDEACRAYRRALELKPSLADAHVNLGRLHHETRELEAAETHYRQASELAPEDPVVWFNLGVLREDQRRHHEALVCYRKAIGNDDDYADAHYNLGLLLDTLGRRSEAMAHLMKARRLLGQG